MTAPRPARWISLLVLGGAVFVSSTAAILIRIAQSHQVPSLTIAAWRLTIAALLLTPVVLANAPVRSELHRLGKRQFFLTLLSGAFLAAHFAAWIGSLAYTSVANSGALVASNPVWIALVSWLWFGERLNRGMAAGVLLALTGSALIFAADTSNANHGSQAMLGNVLALCGSIAVCGYLLIGRALRARMSLLPYVWLVYGAAAIVLLGLAGADGQRFWSMPWVAWLCVAAMAIGPQLLGHGGINWAIKHLSTTLVAVVILGEPVGSALWAWLYLGESLGSLQLAGFVVLLAGIFLASRAEP
ncbi:MAG: DMT family transporter [Betaproteobacteria bacterium]|nr:DMT family transporter [Betaproteobacteria bacterium]